MKKKGKKRTRIRRKNTLSQYLSSSNGELKLNVPKSKNLKFFITVDDYIQTGNIKQAAKLLRDHGENNVNEMVKIAPSKRALMYAILALMFQKTEYLLKAEEWYKKVLDLESNAMILNELANICQKMKRLTDAMQYRKKALELTPEDVGILSNYALDMMYVGRIEQGIEMLGKVLQKAPTSKMIRACYLWNLHYLPELDSQVLLDEHKKWGQMHAPVSMAKTSHNNTPDPDRKLRIGYISPDFFSSSIAHNFDAFIRGRNKNKVEIYGYGNVVKPDEFTEYFKKTFDHYRDIYKLDDKKVVKIIENDEIDILVAIGGYVRDNRLIVLAYKPAPIQVDCWGINTTGMEQVDYRFTDSILDPPHLHKFYVEKTICLPDGFICYRPSPHATALEPLPAIKNGYITFASFNNNLKISSYIMKVWAEVLKANKNSRLLLKFGAASDEEVRQSYFKMFEELGVERQRIDLYGWVSIDEYMRLFGQADIALDTYPYNGTVTTMEAMWMGVPTISLVGENSILSRVGLTILRRLDLEFFAASTPDEFVRKSIALAGNLESLEKIRASIRQRMKASTLCNPGIFASSVESEYRKMWHKWCRSQGVNIEERSGTEIINSMV